MNAKYFQWKLIQPINQSKKKIVITLMLKSAAIHFLQLIINGLIDAQTVNLNVKQFEYQTRLEKSL